jgi:hypothetical protein
MTAPSRIVSIEARPAPLSIDLARSGALAIDMQNDLFTAVTTTEG